MKLQNLEISNYRGIRSLYLPFDSEITVLLGRNGIGKSTILDAIASILVAVQKAWPSVDTSASPVNLFIPASEIKKGATTSRIKLGMVLDQHRTVSEVNEFDLESEYRGARNTEISSNFMQFWNMVHSGLLVNERRTLMVYYRQDRGFEQQSSSFPSGSDAERVLHGSLQGSLQAISNLQVWWDKRDAQEARRVRDHSTDYRDPQLEAIRNIIQEIDGFKGVFYSSTDDPEGLYFRKHGNNDVHVGELSSGERSFIILLADLARRLQIVDPKAKLADIPGIVLIDEIELNLHPAWQSKIISTLRQVFTSCQFIITTHSPQVVSSIESRHVVKMTTNVDGVVELRNPLRTKGQTSNYLLEGVFESTERYPEADHLFSSFNDAIDEKRLELAEAYYRKLIEEVEGDFPELMLMRKRLNKLRSAQ